MQDKLRKKLMVLLAAVFVIGIFLMANQRIQYRQADQVQNKAEQLVMQKPPRETTAKPVTPKQPEILELPEEQIPLISQPEPDDQARQMMTMDIAALQAVNGDVFGWITIPDTKINYPLLEADTAEEYLHTAWDGSSIYSGSIYLESKNARDFSDFHSIIYGHNMANGTMFGNLILYKTQEFAESHPYVYVLSGNTVRRYHIFAAYNAQVESDTYYINFESAARRETAIAYYLSQNVLKAPVIPTGNDRILTLSTCTGTGNYAQRWVVQAVLDVTWTF